MTEEDLIDQELRQMSVSPRVADAVKDHLRRLSRGAAGPELAEMARDLLDGRTSIREVSRSQVYAQQFMDATSRFQKWFSELSPEERENLAKQAEEFDTYGL